jgi:hypothetical protein
VFVHYYLSEGVVLENLFQSLGVITTGGATAVSPCMFRQVFYFLFIFCFWLCASLMSRFSLGVLLLQRLDVFGIILILIYFLYQKKARLVQVPYG